MGSGRDRIEGTTNCVQNIQALKQELDRHEAADVELRQQISEQRAERVSRRSHILAGITRFTGLLEEARQVERAAADYAGQNPTSMEARGALLNAHSIVVGHERKLARLREEYENTM